MIALFANAFGQAHQRFFTKYLHFLLLLVIKGQPFPSIFNLLLLYAFPAFPNCLFSSSFAVDYFCYFLVFTLLHCKRRLTIFPSPAGMSLAKLSLAGNNLIRENH
jgi:hypothetical protein